MSITVMPTATITTENAVFVVEQMSQQVKELVKVMDAYRQAASDANIQLAMATGAIRDIQSQIMRTIEAERNTNQEAAQ